MALTPTLLANESDVGLKSSYTTASISPTADTLLVVPITMKKLFGTAGGAVAVSGLSLTWTNQIHKVQSDGWTDAFTAPAGASPGSGALTISVSGNASDQRWSDIIVHVLQVPVGFDTTTPVAQTASNGASGSTSGATMTVTLGSTPAADSVVIGFIGSMETNGAVTADGTFTELAQDSNGNNDYMTASSQYDDASADTTIQWTAIDRLDGGKHTAAVALEIAAAAAGGDPAPSVSDSATVAESAVATMSDAAVAPSDAATVSESITALLISLIAASDNASVAESVKAELESLIAAQDSATVAESVSLALDDLAVAVSDNASVAESVALALSDALISVSDAASVAESVGVALTSGTDLSVSASDAVTVAESIAAALSDAQVAASDSASLAETVTATLISFIDTSDSVAVAESTVLDVTRTVAVSDTINVAESVTVAIGTAIIAVSDSIGVTDTPNVGSPAFPGNDINVAVSDGISIGELIAMFIMVTPLSHTYAVPHEDRTFAVDYENRTYSVRR